MWARLPRRTVRRATLLILCGMLWASPVVATPSASASPSLTTMARTAANLGEQLTRLELDLAAQLTTGATPRPSSTGVERLTRAGLTSGHALRLLASRTRRALLAPRRDASIATLARARKTVRVLYPDHAETLTDGQLASALDAAATQHDQHAVARAAARAADLAAQGHIHDSAVPDAHLVPPVLGPQAGPSTGVLTALSRHEALRQRQHESLRALATMVLTSLTDGSGRALPSAEELAGTWMRSGPRRIQAITAALAQVGKPYRFAMRGPDSFDCSGLTSYAWAHAGVALRTSSFSQREQVARLERASPALRVGDLVFYDRSGPRRGERVGHVSLALGWGDLIVEANAGADHVRVSRYVTGPLWGFGRIPLVEERTTALLTRPR